jgi:hypothetical protein
MDTFTLSVLGIFTITLVILYIWKSIGKSIHNTTATDSSLEVNIGVVKFSQKFEQTKESQLSVIDISTLSRGFKKIENETHVSIFPTFTLQSYFDTVRQIHDLPLVLDIKIMNNGEKTAFLKELLLYVKQAKLDETPAFRFIPSTSTKGNNLVLRVENLGWGSAHITNFQPLSAEALSSFNLHSEKLNWSGEVFGSNLFVIPTSYIPKDRVLSREDLGEIRSTLNPMRLRTTMMSGGGPNLDKEDKRIRNLYLSQKKGIAFTDFYGYIEYVGEEGQILRKKADWGYQFPNGHDLLFTENGFELAILQGYGAYIPPSHNYDIELSVTDDDEIKSINISHEIKPDSVDRFTMTIIPNESGRYNIQLGLNYNTDEKLNSKPLELHVLRFNEPGNSNSDVWLYNNGLWKKV